MIDRLSYTINNTNNENNFDTSLQSLSLFKSVYTLYNNINYVYTHTKNDIIVELYDLCLNCIINIYKLIK